MASLQTAPTASVPPPLAAMPSAMPALAVEDLHAAYGQSEVLHGLTFAVAPGEIVAVMGRNGMGKTTLMKTLMGLLPVKAGRSGSRARMWPGSRATPGSPRASPTCRRAG